MHSATRIQVTSSMWASMRRSVRNTLCEDECQIIHDPDALDHSAIHEAIGQKQLTSTWVRLPLAPFCRVTFLQTLSNKSVDMAAYHLLRFEVRGPQQKPTWRVGTLVGDKLAARIFLWEASLELSCGVREIQSFHYNSDEHPRNMSTSWVQC